MTSRSDIVRAAKMLTIQLHASATNPLHFAEDPLARKMEAVGIWHHSSKTAGPPQCTERAQVNIASHGAAGCAVAAARCGRGVGKNMTNTHLS